jgi:hypothetical protein
MVVLKFGKTNSRTTQGKHPAGYLTVKEQDRLSVRMMAA